MAEVIYVCPQFIQVQTVLILITVFSYNSHEPPKLIRMWLDKAPMILLIVAAVTFVIGLNLFAYLSLQVGFNYLRCYL